MRTLADLGSAPAAAGPTMLAGLGQRYQDYPAATFDQRFGPYEVGPGGTDDAREQLRRMFEFEQLRRTPGGVIPGTKTFPFGYTLAGDVVQGPWGNQSDYLQNVLQSIRRQGDRPLNPRPSQIIPPAQIIQFPRPQG